MAKKQAGKRDSEKKESGDYEFPAVNFDERAFMRREIESARITFWTTGLAIPVGILAWLLGVYGGDWRLGWLPILAGLAGLGPLLRRMGYSEENTSPKAMFGNWFLLFFTALAIWIVAVNV